MQPAAPAVEHIGGEIPEDLVRAADVITVRPEATCARWSIGYVDVNNQQ